MTKHTVSSATIKGWSRNSHHPRKAEEPVTFVGVDGEGVTDAFGIHRYVLFGIGEQQITDPNGLHWTDIFEFLYSQFKPRTAYVGFFLGYDFTQILKTLPEDKAWMLLTSEGRNLRRHRIPGKPPHPMHHDGWYFDLLGSKRLRIRPKLCSCEVASCPCPQKPWMYICDTGGFFQCSFLKAINPNGWAPGTAVVTAEEYATIEKGKKKRSTAVLDDEMCYYNRLENVILARLMHSLQDGFRQINVYLPPSKWFGPGQAAQAWLKTESQCPTSTDITENVPVWFLEAARMSYFGGWFEIMMHGIIPGDSYEYDINSAYPYIISRLPCLLHGQYSKGDGRPRVEKGEYCLVYAKVWSPNMPSVDQRQHIGTMLHRDSHGRISRPLASEGWFWHHELQAAEKAGTIKSLKATGRQSIIKWVKYSPCDCPPPISGFNGLYEKRLAVDKNSPLGRAAKYVYNSGYGKTAQSIGSPIFGNPIYASLITAGCRTQILEAIASHPKGMSDVAMVATDAVYFLTQHPTLQCDATLGAWDYKVRSNLTLFKPGVYWDDDARQKIASGESPSFKARGFSAADFAASIARVDGQFAEWGSTDSNWEWPSVSFQPQFTLVSALQAIRRKKWGTAGTVKDGKTAKSITQNSNPSDKREGLYRDTDNGRTIYRSRPHFGMQSAESGYGFRLEWEPSHPYTKRFGMDDPWSDEYKSQHGDTPDGSITDILAWIFNND